MKGKLSFFGNPWLSYDSRCVKIDYGEAEFSRTSKMAREPISRIPKKYKMPVRYFPRILI
jgi:hypothetical protein